MLRTGVTPSSRRVSRRRHALQSTSRSSNHDIAPLFSWHLRCTDDAAVNVTIVARNPETLDALQAYLGNAGIVARCTQSLEDARSAVAPVVVLFPDDFERALVLSVLATIRSEQPNVLPVVVTSDPRGFERLVAGGRKTQLLVVPKPVWGWKILDAIRARLSDDT